MVDKLKVFLAALAIAISFGAWPSSGLFFKKGPCDIVSCAEAYSVTRRMIHSYTGPLFQLFNGTSTLDIGQKNGQVDLSTWSAFCGGVTSNCVYSKIYPQINSLNPLVPSNLSGGIKPNCSATTTTCATPFVIEGNTNLPIVFNHLGTEYYIGPNPGADDTTATGINAKSFNIAVVYNGVWIQNTYCCGMFGVTHYFNTDSTTHGTDFMTILGFGQFNGGGIGVNVNCSAGGTFCAGIELESVNELTDTSASNGLNAVLGIDFITPSNTMDAYLNGSQLFSHSPPIATATINVGQHVHLGGGGDLSQYDSTIMREALISNNTISASQQTSINANMKTFYGTATASFFGVGDVVPGAKSYYGLRAYNTASFATPAINVRRSSDGHTCDLTAVSVATPQIGNTINCSNGADNAQTAISFCGGSTCFVDEFYDQTGNGNNLIQNLTPNQPQIIFGCGLGPQPFGSSPCVTFDGSASWLASSGPCAVSTFPATVGFLAKRIGNKALTNTLYTPCNSANGNGNGPFFRSVTDTMGCAFGTSSTSDNVGDSVWHSAVCAATGTGGAISNNLVIDGTNITVTGTNAFNTGVSATMGANNNTGGVATNFFNGNMMEAFSYAATLSIAQMKLICASVNAYYNPVSTPNC